MALGAFGRLLHTVQDFYSHSNWIELQANNSPIPVWDLRVETLPQTIVSGTWFIGAPKRCAEGVPTHEELNKDSPTPKEGQKTITTGPNRGTTLYQLAFTAATAATRVQFDQLETLTLSPNPILKQVGRLIPSQASASDLLVQLVESMRQLKCWAARDVTMVTTIGENLATACALDDDSGIARLS